MCGQPGLWGSGVESSVGCGFRPGFTKDSRPISGTGSGASGEEVDFVLERGWAAWAVGRRHHAAAVKAVTGGEATSSDASNPFYGS